MRRMASSFLAIKFSMVRTLTLKAVAHSFFESSNLAFVIMCDPPRRRFAFRAENHKQHKSRLFVATDAAGGIARKSGLYC